MHGPSAVIGSHTSLRENKFGTQHCNHLNFAGLHGKQARPVRYKPSSLDHAKNQKGNFTHPADLAVLLLIAGWSSSFSPVLRKETVIASLIGARAQLQRESWLMKRKRSKSERVLDTTFAVTLFFPVRSKINHTDQLYGERRNVDQILFLARLCLRSLSGDYSSTSVPFDLLC